MNTRNVNSINNLNTQEKEKDEVKRMSIMSPLLVVGRRMYVAAAAPARPSPSKDCWTEGAAAAAFETTISLY